MSVMKKSQGALPPLPRSLPLCGMPVEPKSETEQPIARAAPLHRISRLDGARVALLRCPILRQTDQPTMGNHLGRGTLLTS